MRNIECLTSKRWHVRNDQHKQWTMESYQFQKNHFVILLFHLQKSNRFNVRPSEPFQKLIACNRTNNNQF